MVGAQTFVELSSKVHYAGLSLAFRGGAEDAVAVALPGLWRSQSDTLDSSSSICFVIYTLDHLAFIHVHQNLIPRLVMLEMLRSTAEVHTNLRYFKDNSGD